MEYSKLYPFRYIGSLTGVKPGVFSVSINERNALKGGYIGLIEWIFGMNRNQSFITFAIRDMLTNAQSYDQAIQYLAKVPLLAPCYYIVAGPKSGQVNMNTDETISIIFYRFFSLHFYLKRVLL